MAKRLGFHPRSLIKSRPDPKQKWKLPAKNWIHELHFQKFGHAIGEKPVGQPQPIKPDYDPPAVPRVEDEVYWKEYWERNSDTRVDGSGGGDWSISDDDVPF